ncbi:Secreted and surface protein [Methanocella conradii HZ254]|uniref:Secreted and surface protein n=1 Tax=Methanocella conradii (strain DSM 24694 / JCM 17849 / CGMCC 1.5162 / HZ254) TaxID=1041930 RepID=H8I4G3_METCZ|nr:fasciclin domain-containing protein [Methanocella conradii]AFD00142.1 Secreted and surface protein [Methanocella conradii HZ254]
MVGLRRILVIILASALLACVAAPALAQAQKSLFDAAVDAGSFSKLVGAVKATNYDTALSTGGPYTILAPTDEAFNKLPAGTMESLAKDKPKLTGVVKNHVISGKYTTDQLVKMGTVSTLDGKRLKVTKAKDGSIMIDGAKIVKPDIQAKNGVIQGIDTVLVPK